MPAGNVVHKISVTEYGPFERLGDHASRLGLSVPALHRHLDDAARKIAENVGVSQPFEFSREQFRVIDVAGLIRLTPHIELEVRPKFLAAADDASWREDFFAVATIARFGRILPHESLRASTAEKGDLADLIGRALVTMYDRNRRRPLRVYRRRAWADFNVDGELDPESALMPDEAGFTQSGVLLDRQNQYNQVISEAMGGILAEIKDGDVRRQLTQRHLHLAPQRPLVRHRRGKVVLPRRHGRWQELYDLSRQIIEGFGLTFDEKINAGLPGYVLDTGRAWESLIFNAVRAGLKDRRVAKIKHTLGVRQTPRGKKGITTTPDMTVRRPDGAQTPVDAKYKGRVLPTGSERLNIQSADLYEALAFCRSARSGRAVLIYPPPGDMRSNDSLPGATAVFERVTLDGGEVVGMTVDPRGISKLNGFRHFSTRLAEALLAFDM